MPDDHINSAHRTDRRRCLRRVPEHGIACMACGRLYGPRILARGDRGGTADQQYPHRNRAVAGWWPMNAAPFTLHVGDARAVLSQMPAGSANCIVTSPPYWGKRDYGVAGQYGHEDSPAAYVATMREVFREARRVLADDGTCWLNLGDSYSASGGGATGMHAYLGPHITTHRAASLSAKNLLGIPWRVAFALQDDGWILRNAIVWHKPNAMPESVRDRLNCRYELIFLLVKSRHYWFDLDPIREPHKTVHQAEPRIARSRTRPPGRPG